ncbi:MAG: M50 family metallopeptidase [Agrococcus casei]|uniref:M50 family metallopeptidase n=2 Tax=Agrococcus casei TaxID=343512 RepID=UPI003F9696D7
MEAVLLFIAGVLVIVVGLAVSIGLHEVGHLLPAKLFKVRVAQYMIGFGPTIFSKRVGETEYGFKWIPLGGYISMSGMYPPAKPGGKARTASTGFFDAVVQDARTVNAETIVEGEETRTFYNLPFLKKVTIMLGGPLMNLVLAVLLYGVLLCGFGTAQPSTTVASVSECVISAAEERTECAADDPLAPAAEAGIQPGDEIVSFGGTAVTDWTQMQGLIRDRADTESDVVIVRDGEELTLTVTPMESERPLTDRFGQIVEENGAIVTIPVGFVGISPQYETVQQPVSAVLPAVGENVERVVHMVLHLPERLWDVGVAAFSSEERDPNGPVSVVGVGRMAGEIAATDQIPVVERVASMVGLLASLNVALFVFNLIPLMPLDGGHILGAVVDVFRRGFAKLFRRDDPGPIDTAKWVPVTMAVSVVLLIMGALLIYADIVKPISLGLP